LPDFPRFADDPASHTPTLLNKIKLRVELEEEQHFETALPTAFLEERSHDPEAGL